ncbi:flagellar FlbD family protein [Alloiococcus sp. CFN-8]|uniref:flagellar FlbD family protein n=1 Tax=Alloiococcus sp. CFN-8 TaxID=3416081 RepID=UPI003CF7B6FB
MVYLTTIGKKQFVLNSEHIEKLEEVPETLITLTNGKKYLVLETPEEVIEKIISFKKKIYNRGC